LPIQRGDFILLDYAARVKETGDIFDTTLEEEARKQGLYRSGTLYEPMLVVVGEGWVLKGLDEALVGVEEGKPSSIEVPPEKGLGPRDPAKIKLIPLRKFMARDVQPRTGMQVEVDGRTGVVRSVGAGRVQVDFNPILAGKTIVYEVTVRKALKVREERMKALIHRRIPSVATEKLTVGMRGGEARITVPEEAFLTDGLQIIKRGLAVDFEKFFPEVNKTTFIETFTRKVEVKPEPKPEPEPLKAERTEKPEAEASKPAVVKAKTVAE